MNLLLDIGNSSIKAAYASGDGLQRVKGKINPERLGQMLHRQEFKYLMVSAVGELQAVLKNCLDADKGRILLDGYTPLPFSSLYRTPHTLGTDRIAAVAGALTLRPGSAVLAIDAGSCITYDYADGQQRYLGGSISPGLQMRCKAMHTFTARLPLVSVKQENEDLSLSGRSTAEAMQSGALYGTVAEITQMIRMYKDKFGNLQPFICGGDARLLSRHLRIPHQWEPDLIFIGLNRILQHNVS
jgi:type III pantothenate kinase